MPDPSSPEHPSGSPLPELAAAITAGAVRLAAATAAWLRLIAEFDERAGQPELGPHERADPGRDSWHRVPSFVRRCGSGWARARDANGR